MIPTIRQYLMLLFFVVLPGCTGKNSDSVTTTDSVKKTQEAYVPEKQILADQPSQADSILFNNMIRGLSEIEKFAVGAD